MKFIYLLMSILLTTTPALAGEVRVSAAASLTDVLKDLAATYRQTHPEVDLLPNFASSGALANQISAGAPADIYISANPKWLDYLEEQGMTTAGTSRILIRNRLVLVGAPERHISLLNDVQKLRKIALGSPTSVPAGKYAEQALSAAGLYRQLQADNKLVPAKDVRQALLYADRGEVDGAFVYRTDALLARRVKILLEVPQELYPQITYPAVLLKGAAEKPAVREFFDYLFSPAAQKRFAKYGFQPAE